MSPLYTVHLLAFWPTKVFQAYPALCLAPGKRCHFSKELSVISLVCFWAVPVDIVRIYNICTHTHINTYTHIYILVLMVLFSSCVSLHYFQSTSSVTDRGMLKSLTITLDFSIHPSVLSVFAFIFFWCSVVKYRPIQDRMSSLWIDPFIIMLCLFLFFEPPPPFVFVYFICACELVWGLLCLFFISGKIFFFLQSLVCLILK